MMAKLLMISNMNFSIANISQKFLITLFFISSVIFSQSNLELNGYFQNMHTAWAQKGSEELVLSNSMTNRINLSWYPNQDLTFRFGLRNIFDFGQFVSKVPFYADFATKDVGYADLTEEITSAKSYILYSNIDRLNLTFTFDNLEIQIGRQRINWGINPVWTPNDIFNSSSFINFDYVEKPGSDALRLQYYIDFATSLELVSKLDYDKNLTLAGRFKINKWNYDFQILGGLTEIDYIFGGGWAGDIYDAGFTGEFTYFKNRKSYQNSDEQFVSSIGANYTFTNSLFVSFEFLYNSIGTTGKINFLNNIFNLDYSAKQLSPARYSIFSQAAYPITPLFNSTLAAILNPSDGSMLLSPTLEFSLNEDVYLLTSGQFFLGADFTEWGDYGEFYYLRIKWNF
jgi:hypothetical protein